MVTYTFQSENKGPSESPKHLPQTNGSRIISRTTNRLALPLIWSLDNLSYASPNR